MCMIEFAYCQRRSKSVQLWRNKTVREYPLIRLIFSLDLLGVLHNSVFESAMDQGGIQHNQD